MSNFFKSTDGRDEPGESTSQDRKRGQKVFVWFQRILLVSGLILVGIYVAARIESFVDSRAALKKFAALEASPGHYNERTESSAPSSETASSSGPMDLPGADFSLWGERRVEAYKESVGKQSGLPLAVLRIPKIQLEAPLFDGTDDFTLNHAVGRIAGTARPGERGNIGIAGHRDSFFRGLKDVGAGDVIELKRMQGTDTYVVDEIQIVGPRDVAVLQPGPVPSLTLVTCYPFYFFGSAPKRYIVKASLSREIKSEARKFDSRPAISSTQFD